MYNPWIEFVKQWALTHNMKYGVAMGDPQMREAYHSRNEAKPATTKQQRVRKPKATVTV